MYICWGGPKMVVPQTIGFPIDNNLVWIILGSPILGNHHMYVCIYIYTPSGFLT
jgi:hypothetical protein